MTNCGFELELTSEILRAGERHERRKSRRFEIVPVGKTTRTRAVRVLEGEIAGSLHRHCTALGSLIHGTYYEFRSVDGRTGSDVRPPGGSSAPPPPSKLLAAS